MSQAENMLEAESATLVIQPHYPKLTTVDELTWDRDMEVGTGHDTISRPLCMRYSANLKVKLHFFNRCMYAICFYSSLDGI